MRKIARVLVLLLLLLGGAAGYGYYLVTDYMDTPLGLSAPLTVTVKRGASLNSVLLDFEQQGIIVHPRWVSWYARAQKRTQVRAGEYVVNPTDTPSSLLTKLYEGRVRTEQFVVIEGHNRWQTRDELVAARWMTAAEFDRLCDDTAFLKKHDIPGPTCEGYLFPETYTFARGLPADAIFTAMFAMFHKVVGEVTAQGRGPLKFDVRAFATFASIIEKETGAPEERPHIACVFYNRLKAKPAWRLETDPTVIYAALLTDPSFDGNLTTKHLRQLDNPYNTYRVFGLPPGPIANAGKAAMLAAANPSTCEDFFFVSNNNGSHIFCPTLDCHNKAVDTWQRHRPRQRRG